MEKIIKIVVLVCLPLTVVAWWQRDNFVAYDWTPPALAQDPLQERLAKPAFEVAFNDVGYAVVPKYDYDLSGVVVSYRYHDGDRMLHKIWNDHLNVADVCVVWGKNIGGVDLNAFDFFNGQFTCNFKTRDRAAWSQFAQAQLSNNHLLTEDPDLRRRITDLNIGDVIRVRGWLSAYGQRGREERFMRDTSTTRDDTGNGACETIYVRDFEVIRSMPNQWRQVFAGAGTALVISTALWVWGVGSGRFSHRAA